MGFVGDSMVGIDLLLFDWLAEWWESQQLVGGFKHVLFPQYMG